jgi:signal transduction histidine kinase
MFLVAGAVLLGITYGLVASSTRITVTRTDKGQPVVAATGTVAVPQVPPLDKAEAIFFGPPGRAPSIVQMRAYSGLVQARIASDNVRYQALATASVVRLRQARSTQLDALLTWSGIALAIMAFVSIGLGWLMAGRALRPLRTMSARARGISERNLHERLAVAGPNDELKELGDTFDGLLGRLETAFESQRRFVANASHELRTPITVERTLVEVALADPEPSIASLRDTCTRVLSQSEQQERLIEALLTLARGQRGLESREEVDLGAIADAVVRSTPTDGVRVESELGEAWTSGDPALVERLVANLVQNAVRYNDPGGWVTLWSGLRAGRPTLEITNSGQAIAAEDAGGLLEPFRRLNGERSARREGMGLGLSIVNAIALAHDAELQVTPRSGGGLQVEVAFLPS